MTASSSGTPPAAGGQQPCSSEAGFVDEIQIHLAPAIFGAGLSMFGGLQDRHIELESIEVIHTATAIHMHFKVVRE